MSLGGREAGRRNGVAATGQASGRSVATTRERGEDFHLAGEAFAVRFSGV